MSIIDKVEDGVKKFILGKALAKGAVSLAKFIVSFCAAKGVQFTGSLFGVPIDLSDVMIMTGAINAALATLRNTLKTKWPLRFGWL